MGYWPIVLNVLKNSDVVVLVGDARVPEMTMNKEIIKKAFVLNKKIVLAFNKTDLTTDGKAKEIKKKYPESFLVSCKNKKGIRELKRYLNKLSEGSRRSLRVGVVGYPNTGKSTIINLLVSNARLKVSDVSGTTKKTHYIKSRNLKIIDSPGVIPFGDSVERTALVSAKNPNKIKNPERTAIRIINFVSKKTIQDFYKVNGENVYEVFLEIGKKKCLLLKKGEIDERRTAIKIIDDWQKGKIRNF